MTTIYPGSAVATKFVAEQPAEIEVALAIPDAPARAVRTPVPPGATFNVANETIAAIQELATVGTGRSLAGSTAEELERRAQEEAVKKPPEIEIRSFQEIQAEARRWERYYAHQPRRLADLLAVYYGGGQASIDARGPHAKSMIEEINGTD
jgi:hypothetical protein